MGVRAWELIRKFTSILLYIYIKVQRIRVGKKRLRWEDDVIVDLRKVKIQNWSKVTG